MSLFKGVVCFWSGAVSDIPEGWCLCDGRSKNGDWVPDLRDMFVPCSGSQYGPGDWGFGGPHRHPFTGDGHHHTMPYDAALASAAEVPFYSTTDPAVGTTEYADNRPKYYALCFIIKL